MKKRILSLLLALVMCLTLLPVVNVSAAPSSNPDTAAIESLAQEQVLSDWAIDDLIVGDTYGIYPVSWYTRDMTAPVSRGQLIVLLAGIRNKILDTDSVVVNTELLHRFGKTMTVEQVIDVFYTFLSGYEFTADIGIKAAAAVDFMKENGIYGAVDGEQALTETCSVEQACVMGTRLITYLFDKLDAASKGFLWVTKSGNNTVYMLGSIHLASTDIYPFSQDILKAYQSSDALGVELNLYDAEGPQKIMELGIYTDGTTLKDHVSADTYQKAVEFAALFGYSEELISLLKPWYIYISFAALTTTDSGDLNDAAQAAALGIDFNLTTNALLYGKPVLELEGYEYQGQVLDSFSDGLQEFLLNGTIDAINDLLAGKESGDAESLELALDLWRDGDADTFKQLNSLEDEYPEIYSQEEAAAEKALMDEFIDKLITQRDKRMADYIDNLLKAEGGATYFIIVGSAHYISDYSVLDILKDKGYEITQIK
jgi:uncharacterized protein YbaP (TraB family)